MKLLILTLAAVLGGGAWAMKCPNISGKYIMDTSHGHDTTIIKQSSCKKITFIQKVAVDEKKTQTIRQTYILDGKWRPDKSFEDQKPVKSQAKMGDTGVEIVQRTSAGKNKEDENKPDQKVTLSLDREKNLLIEKKIPEVWQRAKK